MSRLLHGGFSTWIELLLLALAALQLARLVWTALTPIGPYGDWRPHRAVIGSPEMRKALFSSFDPFFHITGQGDGQITKSFDLKLFGTRINEGSDGGSAIIATPDQTQGSYAPGDEILPKVILKSVSFDHVVIDRAGREEILFIDQSATASLVQPDGVVAAQSLPDTLNLQEVQAGIGMAPRVNEGRITGISISPAKNGETFRLAGFQPGDVIVQVNGRAISSGGDIQAFTSQLQTGSSLALQIERRGRIVPITLTLSNQ